MADMASSLAALLQVPGMQELFNQAITTQRQQAPLRTALTQQSVNMLPGAAFGAGGMGARPNIASIAPANFVTPAPQSSTLGNILKSLAAGGAGLAAANAASGGNLMNALKKLFGGGGGISNPFTPSTPGTPLSPGNPYDPTSPSSFLGWQGQTPGGLLTSDPGVYYGETGGGATVTDPSGGTGVGPGMQQFYGGGSSQSDGGDGSDY